ncbi:hypothetical protein PsorP6_015801 [Peronosclerospora sorghi]|uniref:Uncharacterized protein n=1 Tax=Peronosclerospora sorghi TaxID=230839 RepID=A0ACC0WNL4_9STRA|nr:hypothetical protein PsorP6_015801 [Peronosclerospora sorghi]
MLVDAEQYEDPDGCMSFSDEEEASAATYKEADPSVGPSNNSKKKQKQRTAAAAGELPTEGDEPAPQ